MSELKACPMCGGQAEIWTQKSFGMPLIRCECGLSLSGEMNCFLRDDIKELEDAWNNRVAPAKDAPMGLLEQIDRVINGRGDSVRKVQKVQDILSRGRSLAPKQ